MSGGGGGGNLTACRILVGKNLNAFHGGGGGGGGGGGEGENLDVQNGKIPQKISHQGVYNFRYNFLTVHVLFVS